MPKGVVIAAHRARHFRAPQTLATWGHGWASSGRWAHRGAGPARVVQVVCPPVGLTGAPRLLALIKRRFHVPTC
jgi:hypothetical protein